MGFRKHTDTPLDIDVKQILVGLGVFIASFPIGLVTTPAWGGFCFLLGISLILLSIDRDATLRAGRYVFGVALVVLGIALGLLLCQ
jgi:hypothetical protein